ncbi:MAG: pyruvate kinase, partial [Myxococcota bacterium]
MPILRRAKIVATLGPVSSDETAIGRLLAAGADVFRLNLSHGSHATHAATIAAVRRAAGEAGREIPVLLDLMGPRFRLGELPSGPRTLRRGEKIALGAGPGAIDLPVDDPGFLRHLKVGERVLIDNGLVEIEVTAKRARRVAARVVHGGTVATRKGLNLPDSKIPFTISAKDRADIEFAVIQGADFLAASYIGRAKDVEAVREVARAFGAEIPVIAKLERAAAVAHIDEIVAASDAVMV